MMGLQKKSILAITALASIGAAAPYRQYDAPADIPSYGGKQHQYPNSTAATGKAIYFLTNDAQNAVVALPIGQNGMLSKGTVTKTGGAGSNAINGATKQPAKPDALVGQSALTVVGNNIFAVNAGSNTLTMLSISPSDPTSLRVLNEPVSIPGTFPNTVSVSPKNKLVCVGTTGAKSGISCASFSTSEGLGQMDALRTFDLGQTTPPVGPTNTVSHTFFSLDESVLLTTVKGNPAMNKTGFLSSFPVKHGAAGVSSLSTCDTRSSPNGTAVLFGSANIPNKPDTIFVADPSFGAAVLSLSRSAQASVVNAQTIPGQKATCWSTISAATNSAFVTDAALNRVVEMSLDDASIISQLDLSANGDPGLTDLRSAGNFVYALSPGNGSTETAITVLDVSGGQGSMKMAQHFGLNGTAGANAQGMAVLI